MAGDQDLLGDKTASLAEMGISHVSPCKQKYTSILERYSEMNDAAHKSEAAKKRDSSDSRLMRQMDVIVADEDDDGVVSSAKQTKEVEK